MSRAIRTVAIIIEGLFNERHYQGFVYESEEMITQIEDVLRHLVNPTEYAKPEPKTPFVKEWLERGTDDDLRSETIAWLRRVRYVLKAMVLQDHFRKNNKDVPAAYLQSFVEIVNHAYDLAVAGIGNKPILEQFFIITKTTEKLYQDGDVGRTIEGVDDQLAHARIACESLLATATEARTPAIANAIGSMNRLAWLLVNNF